MRMIQRFQDQLFHSISSERRARKFFVMGAQTQGNFRFKNNKENEDPLNNNTPVPFAQKHSTPLKNTKVTDLDESEEEVEFNITKTYMNEEEDKPNLVISKIYDLEDLPRKREKEEQNIEMEKETREEEEVEEREEKADKLETESADMEEYRVPEIVIEEKKLVLDDRHWKSLEDLYITAEDEFYRSLEESKLFLSTSSLLEEIEADLPAPYSLARPLNHTFHTLTSYRSVTRLARMVSNIQGRTESRGVLLLAGALEKKATEEGNSSCPEMKGQNNKADLSMKKENKKLEYLEMEAMVQKALGKQAEKALNLSKVQKFLGVEHVECEKTLLLANLRMAAANQQLEKLRILGDVEEKEDFGQLTISEIFFTVENSEELFPCKFVCTMTEKENVQSSPTVSEIVDGKLHFVHPFRFQNLTKDFVICIELFRLHCKEGKKAILASALKRKLKQMASAKLNRSIADSLTPGSSGFTCAACAQLRLQQVTGRKGGQCVIPFAKSPQYPVLENPMIVTVTTGLNIKESHKGFMNVFRQTWHRRWFSLAGFFFECWLYPEDQDDNKPPLESVYLPNCPEEAKSVGLDVCIRPHSFVLGESLFSADSQRNMNKWINLINSTIENIRLWKPDV